MNNFFAVFCQDEEDEVYRGRRINDLNTYHHQVSGVIYAVDEYTLLLRSFSYDGNGADTFFWAGATNRPGPQGFIVPDEWGKSVKINTQVEFSRSEQSEVV